MVAVAKADELAAGQWLSAGAIPPAVELPGTARNATIAIAPADRKDDVRLASALARLAEEDASLTIEHDEDSHELRLRGVNDEHLALVVARLKRRYGVEVTSAGPARSAIANRSGSRCASMAATRSSRAGMASSAT